MVKGYEIHSARPVGPPPLIVHVIHHLVIGGLENGLVNLVNRIPPQHYRHAIVCMADYSEFSQRIRRDGVQIFAMHKKSGQDISIYVRLHRLFRRLRPQIVHTRNLSALDSLLPAILAGVPCRIHGEHGRDANDLDGSNRKHQWLRRVHRPMVDHYVSVSKDLESYLHETIGVPRVRITQIYNGVDTELFHPSANGRENIGPFADPAYFVVGTVGRMQPVKDHMTLVRAVIDLWRSDPRIRARLRLVMIGDGPSRKVVEDELVKADMAGLAWCAGAREDVPAIMRGFSLFVLPSLSEGISNTLLEAMASGLPIVATRVGGNPELVRHGCTGTLVPSANQQALASAIRDYFMSPEMVARHGSTARGVAEQHFGLDVMVKNYTDLYDRMLAGSRRFREF